MPDPDEDPSFYWQDLSDTNADDLRRSLADGNMLGIVSEADGGIIAYALDADYANRIIRGLSGIGEPVASEPSAGRLARDVLDQLGDLANQLQEGPLDMLEAIRVGLRPTAYPEQYPSEGSRYGR